MHFKKSKKNILSIFSVLIIFSLFGYAVTTSFTGTDNFSNEESTIDSSFSNHPLTGQSDDFGICGNDQVTELHSVYLCGANDERVLTAAVTNASSIVWSKLQEGSCEDATPGCPNQDFSCIWDQLSTNTQYTVSEGGEYRISVEYVDGSRSRYYFNVFANGLNPSTVVSNLDCNGPGSITVNNIPSNYEFSIDNGTNWADSNVFSISSTGSYDILIRRKDNTEGCEFSVENIVVNNNSINATPTLNQITCNTTKGSIQVEVADASASYIYKISNGGSLVNSFGPTSDSSYIFNNLDSGTYDIEVSLSDVSNCSWAYTGTISDYTSITPNAVVTKNIDCDAGIITVSENGGTPPYKYSTDNGASFFPFNSGNQTAIDIATAGVYTIRVSDVNGCEVDANTVNIITEQEIAYTINKSNVSCNGVDDGSISINVTDAKGYSITYSKDGGATFQTSKVFSNLAPATYPITIKKEKAGNSCLITYGDVIIEPNATFTVEANITQQIDCTSGFAVLEANVITGGVAPFEYSLDGNTFQTNTDFTNLGAGEYTLTVKDANNCLATVDKTISAGTNLSDLTFTVTDVNCTAGTSDVLVTVTGGNAPFTYEITAPTSISSPDNTFIDLTSGTYTFQVTADDGCKIVRNYTVPVATALEVNTTVKANVSCFGSTTPDGSIDLTVNNFNTSYDFSIVDSSGGITNLGQTGITTNTITINGIAADTYTINVTDASGSCSVEKTFEIQEPSAALTVSAPSVSNINCGSPGSVTINASGGWGNYTYSVRQPDNSITTAQSGNTINGLDQLGLHTVIVTDINGCSDETQTFDIIDNGGPTATVDATLSDYCYTNTSSAELKIDITDGTAPFYYSINNGTPQLVTGTTFTLNGLTPDDYQIRVIGNNGCETLVADTKIEGQLFASVAMTKPLGCGATPDAIIQITAQGGYPNPDYIYEVSNDGGITYNTAAMPFTTSNADTYQFKIIDSKGCETYTDPVTTVLAPNLTVTPDVTDTKCGLAGSGGVNLEVNGGTGPFSYSLDGGSTFVTSQPFFANLDAQDYDYVVIDDLGCEVSGTITIGAGTPPSFTVDLTEKDIECPATLGGAMQWGRIYITDPVDAVAPYNIRLNLSNGRTIRNYNNVNPAAAANQDSSGNFEYDIRMFWTRTMYVEVEDARGCIYTSANFTVQQPELPVTYSGPAQGVTQSCANGGPVFDLEITNELAGPFRYKIWPRTLVDADDDGVFDDFNTYEPFDTASNQHPSYNGSITGNRVMRFGPPQHDLLFGVNYRVVIYDESTGCYRWRTLGEIEVPSPGMDVTVENKSLSCRNSTDGAVRINVTNHDQTGDLYYEITYTGNPTNIVRSGTVSGAMAAVSIEELGLNTAWYVVSVTDASGCKTGENFPIYRPRSALSLNVSSNINANCFTGAQVTVNGSGGWNNQSYYQARNSFDPTWRPYEYAIVLQTDTSFDPSTDSGYNTTNSFVLNPTQYDGTENVYSIYVRDASGCYAMRTVTVNRDNSPEITDIDVPNRCSATNELYTVNATITDGEGTNIYMWNGEVTNSATAILGPGTHTLTVKDANGCTDTESIFIYPQMAQPKANITQVEQCDPINSGEITIEVYGGSLDYTFKRLDNSEVNTTGIFTGLTHSTTYDFSVTDNQSGCAVKYVSASLDAPASPDFATRVIQNVSCNGGNDGSIIVEQVSGAQNTDVVYEYSLDGVTYQNSNLFENLTAANNYGVHVRSSKNCVQMLPNETITEPSLLVLATPLVSDFECSADNSLGMATITVSTLDGGGTATGTGPYKYSFNGSDYSSDTSFETPFTNAIQTVTIDVIDANNCTDQITANIPAATKLQSTISENQVMTCDDDAIMTINTTLGSGNYTITEVPNASAIVSITGDTVTIEKGNPGTYVFEVYDTTTKCSVEVSYTATPFNTIAVGNMTKINDASCKNSSDGEFTFEVSGFANGFSYEVYETGNTTAPFRASQNSNVTTAISVDTLPSGIYYVEVTDDNTGCISTSTRITILAPSLSLDFDSLEITREIRCNPVNDAEVTAIAYGGWGGYIFQVTNTNTGTITQSFDANNVFSNLEAGVTYEIALRDSKGCANIVRTIAIPSITNIVVDNNPIVIQPSCFGAGNGSIEVTATNGDPTSYKYVLNNLTTGVDSAPQASPFFSNLLVGDYTVTVSDDLGCGGVTSPSITIANPGEVEIDGFISKEPTCLSLGEITVNAVGGSGSFEYRIISPVAYDTGWSGQTVYPLDAGTYEFIARDIPNGCVSPISVIRTINSVDPLNIMIDDSNITINCFGETDAVLVAKATGGLGGYQYQLEIDGTLSGVPQDNGIFENLGQGNYRIVATSGTDCEIFSSVIPISEPTELIAVLESKNDVTCFEASNGSITIDASGGETPYTYIISSEPSKAVTTNSFTGLSGGTYFVIVQDKNGCEIVVDNINIQEPTESLAATTVRIENEVCSSDGNGIIELEVVGGTMPYSYNLTDTQDPFTSFTGSNLTLDSLDGGIYIINIKDANGCTTSIAEEVQTGSNLEATIETASLCSDGDLVYNAIVILADTTQNMEDLVYDLDDPSPNNPDVSDAQANADFNNIGPGNHTISIVNLLTGCIEVNDFNIEEEEELILMDRTREINQIFVEAEGGDGNYTYYFDDIPQSDGSYYINESGEYTVRVIDGKGCEATLVIPLEFIDIVIPDFFTPDGDGINDTWVIKNSAAFPNIHVTIFDRNGRKLEEFLGQGEWNGDYNNQSLPAGDYWYILKLNGRNDLRQFTGHFTIYR